MFNCRKNTELVSGNLDRKLSFFQRMSMTMHGLMCGACRAYRRQLESLEALIKHHYQQPTGTDKPSGKPTDSDSSQPKSTNPHGLSPEAREDIQKNIDAAVAQHKNQ